jgi:hypothetical protein
VPQVCTTTVTADSVAAPVLQSPPPGKTRNPHRPSPSARGFVHGQTAPSMTIPALTYFQSATRSLRASATIADFF